jgi:hypothetical protein
MRAFIEDYVGWVREYLGDPGRSNRLTPESVLRDLHAEHMVIYEELLKASYQDTVIGYTEATIKLRRDTEFYNFPGNFRQFLGLERRLVDNPRTVVDRLSTKRFGSRDRGITISSAQRGFKATRVPIVIEESQDWVLMYQKQPVVLHWADDGELVTDQTVRLPSSVPESQGEIVPETSYYVGELLHVIDPGAINQSIPVTAYNAVTRILTKFKYEFRTVLPRGIDKLIACSVALGKTSDRTDSTKHRLLVKERRKFLQAARNWFRTATQDRAPTIRGRGVQTLDPMAKQW